ncbi:MAG: Fic family protein [Oscillospiraceae bacterium]|nr:Fic family protein [Oscillospiraceae bacterium]
MRYFDYSFLKDGLLPASLINVVESIAKLHEREIQHKSMYPDVFTSLESIAKVQSIKGSNEIEGIVTSDQRINEIVNQNSTPINHDEAEIAGYRDALNLIHTDLVSLDINEHIILRLHAIMLSYTTTIGGEYKKDDNVILEIDASGARRIRFSPTPASETKVVMEQLILAFMDARSSYSINQLLLIPCFILDFLCIHPFADGNGRISRLLTLMLLYKNGFDVMKYISFEEQINKTKNEYYEALKLSSEGWHDGTNSYFPFMENFITTLLYCYKELDKRFALVNEKKVSKRERIEATVLNSLLPISKSEICYILPDVSPTTVEAVLAMLVKSGAVEKVGAGRSTKYLRR